MSNNNNKAILRLRDEESNPGHEIILRSLPNENEMAAANNHPKEEPDKDEMHSGNSNNNRWRWCPAWRRSRALTAFLAAAGVGAAVGGGSAVFRAAGAGGKASTTITSNMQVANVPAPDGYEVVGDGVCVDGNSQGYPNVQYFGDTISSTGICATICNACVAGDFTFVGMAHSPTSKGCACFVSQTVPNVDLSQINSNLGCGTDLQSSSEPGAGPIAGTNQSGGGWTCYSFVGGGSETDAPSIAPSESPGTAKASKRPRGPKASKMPKASSILQVQQMTSGGDPSFSSLSVVGVCGTFAVIIITFMFIDLI